jgi:hypothetical protein
MHPLTVPTRRTTAVIASRTSMSIIRRGDASGSVRA